MLSSFKGTFGGISRNTEVNSTSSQPFYFFLYLDVQVEDSQSRLKNRFLVSKETLTSLKSRLYAMVHIDNVNIIEEDNKLNLQSITNGVRECHLGLTFSSSIFFLKYSLNFFLPSPSQVAPTDQIRAKINHGSINVSTKAMFSAGIVSP